MTTRNIRVDLDTPLSMITPRELFEMQSQWMDEKIKQIVKSSNNDYEAKEQVKYVNTISDLAKELGASRDTIYRMKREGLLDDAIIQYGRWMQIDVIKVREAFRISNHRRK